MWFYRASSFYTSSHHLRPVRLRRKSNKSNPNWKRRSKTVAVCRWHDTTYCDPIDCSLPGSSVHGIFQARVLEWVAISFSRGSSQSKDRTRVSCIAGRCFTIWATREAQEIYIYIYIHTHIYTYIYTHTHIYTYIYTHTHIYIHIYIYTHIYIYIYTHTHTHIYI